MQLVLICFEQSKKNPRHANAGIKIVNIGKLDIRHIIGINITIVLNQVNKTSLISEVQNLVKKQYFYFLPFIDRYSNFSTTDTDYTKIFNFPEDYKLVNGVPRSKQLAQAGCQKFRKVFNWLYINHPECGPNAFQGWIILFQLIPVLIHTISNTKTDFRMPIVCAD